MNIIIFYEKPGCATNKQQKALLKEAGYRVIERNLLQHELSLKEFKSFLKTKPKHEWFNPRAPQIKTGLINPDRLSEEEATRLLFDTPILIKRPLMLIEGERLLGFDQNQVQSITRRLFSHKVSNFCSVDTHSCEEGKRSVS